MIYIFIYYPTAGAGGYCKTASMSRDGCLVSVFAGKSIVAKESSTKNTDVYVSSSDSAFGTARELVEGKKPWISGPSCGVFLSFDFQFEPIIIEKFRFSFQVMSLKDRSNPLRPRCLEFIGGSDTLEWDCLAEWSEENAECDKVYEVCSTNTNKMYRFLKIRQKGTNTSGTNAMSFGSLDVLSQQFTSLYAAQNS